VSPTSGRPGVTRALIGEAALAILDESRSESDLTMRLLAARLGVQAPSLYAHVSGIEDVITLVHKRINASIDTGVLEGSEDLEDLRTMARNYLESYRSHRVAATIIVSRAINEDYALAIYEPIAAFLERIGVPAASVMPIMALLDYLVLGSAVEPFSAGFIGTAKSYDADYPALGRALRGSPRRRIDESGFELGMTALCTTIEAMRNSQIHGK
jgi:AcrR family transcriptional regulator